MATLTDRLGLDPSTLSNAPDDPAVEAPHLLLIRNTLMNPWLRFENEGQNYVDRYLAFLEERIRAQLNAPSVASNTT